MVLRHHLKNSVSSQMTAAVTYNRKFNSVFLSHAPLAFVAGALGCDD
jgi:hypothetical protein